MSQIPIWLTRKTTKQGKYDENILSAVAKKKKINDQNILKHKIFIR